MHICCHVKGISTIIDPYFFLVIYFSMKVFILIFSCVDVSSDLVDTVENYLKKNYLKSSHFMRFYTFN